MPSILKYPPDSMPMQADLCIQSRRHAVKSGPAEVRARVQDTTEGESTRGGIWFV